MSTIIINGSSRKNGNTSLINQYIKKCANIDEIYLVDYSIEAYRYDHNYTNEDQFLTLISKLTNKYDVLLFSTPMYWYSMSGLMKIFLDRFTDLLKTQKTIGRKLRGKSMGLIYNNAGLKATYFEKPFEYTADYLGMQFAGSLHIDMTIPKLTVEDKIKIQDFCSLFI